MSLSLTRRILIGVYKVEHVWTVDDYIWTICMPLCAILLLLCLILLILLIYNFLTMPKDQNASKEHIKVQNKIKFLSLLTAFLSFICNSIYFSAFPGCVEYLCQENRVGHFYFLGTLDSYIISRLSLYFLLCFRIYTSFRSGAYSYDKRVYIVLATFVMLSFCGLLLFNIAVVLGRYHGVYGMPISAISLYCAMDISLGIMTMVLFVKPLYKLMRFKKQMGDDVGIEGMDEMNNIAVRYIILSLTTLISSVFVGLILAIRFLLGFAHRTEGKLIFSISYLNIMVLFSVIDGFITILCIYMYFEFGHGLYEILCKRCYEPVLERYEKQTIKRPEIEINVHSNSLKMSDTSNIEPKLNGEVCSVADIGYHSEVSEVP